MSWIPAPGVRRDECCARKGGANAAASACARKPREEAAAAAAHNATAETAAATTAFGAVEDPRSIADIVVF